VFTVATIDLPCMGSGKSGAHRPSEPPAHSPAEVLLVYNATSPISTAIAKDYAAKRDVTKTVVSF
jgi:hypothetical protein